MANLIVEKSPAIRWYTDLYPFLSLVRSTVREHEWLWTDVVVNAEIPIPWRDDGVFWLSGETLLQFVQRRPLFDWSVFSAIPQDLKNAAMKVDCYPFADGNKNLWVGSPVPQHPHAQFEIVCWDSSSTLLIGADEELADAFRKAYPGTLDLDVANSRRRQE